MCVCVCLWVGVKGGFPLKQKGSHWLWPFLCLCYFSTSIEPDRNGTVSTATRGQTKTRLSDCLSLITCLSPSVSLYYICYINESLKWQSIKGTFHLFGNTLVEIAATQAEMGQVNMTSRRLFKLDGNLKKANVKASSVITSWNSWIMGYSDSLTQEHFGINLQIFSMLFVSYCVENWFDWWSWCVGLNDMLYLSLLLKSFCL